MSRPTGDDPRLLAPSGRRSDQLGYTDIPALAMRDEPEALSASDYERHVLGRRVSAAEQQAAVAAARLEQSRRLLTAEQRLDEACQEARSRHVDVSSEARLIRLLLLSQKRARHVEARLGVLERRVYRGLL